MNDAELFTSQEPDEGHFWFCISQGVNPETREPWTEQEVATLQETVGFDPRDPEGWLKMDRELRETEFQLRTGGIENQSS